MVAPNLQIVPHEGGIVTNVNPEMKTLYGKMARVMGKIAPVEKTGVNDYHKYKFQTADAIANAVRNILADEGIAFFVSMSNVNQEERTDSKGKPTTLTTATFDFTFACSETGATITHRWFAESLNSSDKGINQVATAAAKYFLMKTFLISTPDESDADTHSQERGNKAAEFSDHAWVDFKNQLYAESHFIDPNPDVVKETINFLAQSGSIKPSQDLNTAMGFVILNQASKVYNLERQQLLEALQVSSWSDWDKSHAEAWEAVVAYAECKNDPPAQPVGSAVSFNDTVKQNAEKAQPGKGSRARMSDAPEDGPDPKAPAPKPA